MKSTPKLLAVLIALSCAAVPALGADSKAYYLGDDVSSYKHFIIYPHLEKGFAALDRSDYSRAIAEFRRARELAPQNVRTALFLASAYQRFGDKENARSVLNRQLAFTPQNTEIQTALNALTVRAPVLPLAKATRQKARSGATTATAALAKPARTVSLKASLRDQHLAQFQRALKVKNYPLAQQSAERIWRESGHDAGLLDMLSFQLVTAGAKAEPVRLLLEAYPFPDASPSQKTQLLGRLAGLAAETAASFSAADRERMKTPLPQPQLRSQQARIFAAFKECRAVHALLSDLSPQYRADDWIRLGDCYRERTPGLAQYAYAKARESRPDAYTARLLAYQAFASHDFESALAAWKSIPLDTLNPTELLAAAETAQAAQDATAAQKWLDAYAASNSTPDERYHWLRARHLIDSDPHKAKQHLNQAIALKPEVKHFGKLAYLHSAGGDHGEAVKSLEQALALEPDNAEIMLALGYAYWRAGQTEQAHQLLQRVRTRYPNDKAIVQQLVYVNQRRGQNETARDFARQAMAELDLLIAETAPDDPSHAQAQDMRFGLSRLHEDLGRRWSLNVDANSGNHASALTNAPTPGAGYRSYSQIELDYRLGDSAINDGRTFSAYARIFAGSGENEKALPVNAPVFGAGLRWKPWRDQVIYFALEQQFPLDGNQQSSAETMLRASASFFNAGQYSDDWHASGSGWWSQNLYLDAAHYLRNSRTALTADYRAGYHHKIGESKTLEPYTHIQYNRTTSGNLSERDVRIGLGIRWNWWHSATQHDAYPGKLSLGLELQHPIETYLSDQNSLFLTFGGRW